MQASTDSCGAMEPEETGDLGLDAPDSSSDLALAQSGGGARANRIHEETARPAVEIVSLARLRSELREQIG